MLVFLKLLSIREPYYSMMGKMEDCPKICFKTLHQKGEEERIGETRILIIIEFGCRLYEDLLHSSLHFGVCWEISVTKMN